MYVYVVHCEKGACPHPTNLCYDVPGKLDRSSWALHDGGAQRKEERSFSPQPNGFKGCCPSKNIERFFMAKLNKSKKTNECEILLVLFILQRGRSPGEIKRREKLLLLLVDVVCLLVLR